MRHVPLRLPRPLPVLLGALLSALLPGTHVQAATPAPPGAEVYFISPQDGATLNNPLTVRFGLRNMGVAPAGVQRDHTGHHHLLIDIAPPPPGLPIPSDAQHLHFGLGQTETILELPAGRHTLRLLLGDHNHIPHDPPVLSAPVTITVR